MEPAEPCFGVDGSAGANPKCHLRRRLFVRATSLAARLQLGFTGYPKALGLIFCFGCYVVSLYVERPACIAARSLIAVLA